MIANYGPEGREETKGGEVEAVVGEPDDGDEGEGAVRGVDTFLATCRVCARRQASELDFELKLHP